MESDRFAASRLLGKLVNICPDLPSQHLTGTSTFKAVTGGDAIHAEYKYKESFEFVPFARLVFSANQAPRSEDATFAFFRRWLVVPFDKTFEGSEVVPRQVLDAKLSDPSEQSGVLNKALAVLPRVREKGFTESESMRVAWEEFRAMTDPISVWLDKATVLDANAVVPKSELCKAYNDQCDLQGRSGMNIKVFGRALKRIRPNINESQRTINGQKVWCWSGLGLASNKPEPPEQGPGVRYTNQSRESLKSRKSRNSTNCCSTYSREKDEIADGGDYKITNKGISVTSVTSVPKNHTKPHENGKVENTLAEGGSASPDPLANLFDDPPEWWVRDAKRYIAQGLCERLINRLATDMADVCLNDRSKWREVRPHVETKLEEMREGGA